MRRSTGPSFLRSRCALLSMAAWLSAYVIRPGGHGKNALVCGLRLETRF